jgi:hypothetical protein
MRIYRGLVSSVFAIGAVLALNLFVPQIPAHALPKFLLFQPVSAPAPSYSNTKSMQCDGVDEYAQANDANSLDITNHVSISMWIKGPAQGAGTDMVLAKGLGSDNTRGYEIIKAYNGVNSGESAGMYVNENGAGSVRKSAYTTASVFDGTWHHFVAAWSAAGGMKFWVDGSPTVAIDFDTAGSPASINSNTGPLRFCARTPASQEAAVTIAQLEIWNTGVLTDADVTALHNGGASVDPTTVTPSAAVLVSWWTFGDDSNDAIPTAIYDQTVNDNDIVSFTSMEAGDLVTDAP